MANPLSPLSQEQLNIRSPMTATRNDKLDLLSRPGTPSKQMPSSAKPNDESVINWDDDEDVGSSPFQTEAESRNASNAYKQTERDPEIDAIFEDPDGSEEQASNDFATLNMARFAADYDKENMNTSGADSPPKKTFSPMKLCPSSVSRHGSPQRPSSSSSGVSSVTADSIAMPPPSTRKTARFMSPNRSSPHHRASDRASQSPLPKSRDGSFETVESRKGVFDEVIAPGNSAPTAVDESGIDDTCFSTFSAIPEMTVFARLGQNDAQMTPRANAMATPRTSRKRVSPSQRSPSPTPRRLKTPATAARGQDESTNFLIDFTQQIESFSSASHFADQQRTPAKTSTQPDLLRHLNSQRSPQKMGPRMSTPAKSTSLINLLDFELPPAPTPRSVPSITVRELESMKSSYMSQISSLKATLSGREAEVDSLKKAVADAERRVGEAQEKLREEKSRREHAEQEGAGWEKRSNEMENLLKNVREEVLQSEAEKESLAQRVEDSQRQIQDAESKSLDLESQLASARAAASSVDGKVDEAEVQRLVQAQIDARIEAVGRELHAVYKKKHETKVMTLKKSYEARSEKKCAELQGKVDRLTKEVEALEAAKDNTLSDAFPHDNLEARQAMEDQRAMIEAQRAELHGLSQEMKAFKAEYTQTVRELEQERIEKGELVAAVDEMLLLQSTDGATAAVEDFRKSIQRPAAFRPPVPAHGVESRIGRGGAPSGIARPGAGKSKIVNNIERMGARHAE